MEKKRKADEKRSRRKERKSAEAASPQVIPDDGTEDVAQAADDLPADDD